MQVVVHLQVTFKVTCQARSQDVLWGGGGGGGGAYLNNRDQIINVLNDTLC